MNSCEEPQWDDVLRPLSYPEQLIDFQLLLLETLFGDMWFQTDRHRKHTHPAFKRWEMCRTIRHLGGRLVFPEHRGIVRELASMLLDNMAIAQCSGGERLVFSLGAFANYGDEKVQRRITRAIDNGNSFLSLMTEFAYGASHLLAKRTIRAFEDEGLADFTVTDSSLQHPLYADAKRIAPGTSRRRYKNLLDKINKQVKASQITNGKRGYGLGVIDITNHVCSEERSYTDSIPRDVEEIRNLVQRLLCRYYSSVSGVVLLWDSHSIIGSPVICMPNQPIAPPHALVVMVRRNVVIRHEQPQFPLPDNVQWLRSEYTITFSVGGAGTGIPNLKRAFAPSPE